MEKTIVSLFLPLGSISSYYLSLAFRSLCRTAGSFTKLSFRRIASSCRLCCTMLSRRDWNASSTIDATVTEGITGVATGAGNGVPGGSSSARASFCRLMSVTAELCLSTFKALVSAIDAFAVSVRDCATAAWFGDRVTWIVCAFATAATERIATSRMILFISCSSFALPITPASHGNHSR